MTADREPTAAPIRGWLRADITVKRWWLLLLAVGWFLLALGRILEWIWA